MYILPPFLLQPALLVLPLAIVGLLSFMVLPACLQKPESAKEVSRAAFSYLAQSLGILLMTIGGVPAAFAVFSQQLVPSGAYLALLLVFAVGGLLFLQHDTRLGNMSASAKALPGSIFFYTWKLVGLTIALFAGLSAMLSIATVGFGDINEWWVNQMVLLLYGLLICWFTLEPRRKVAALMPVLNKAPIMPKKPVKKAPAGKMKLKTA